jgi:sRNA-binding carbon storage regulator CsrA
MGLVVSRKPRDGGVVCDLGNGQTLKVEIVDVRGEKVRLHFEGPESVKILRTELLDTEVMSDGRPGNRIGFGQTGVRSDESVDVGDARDAASGAGRETERSG